MKRYPRHPARGPGGLVDDETGAALLLALIILLILTGLVIAFLAASAFEPQISRNHSLTVRARYVAEAGIEYAYDTLATQVDSWNDYLAGATCAEGVILGAASATLPGLGSAYGTFTVRLRNDCDATDQMLTGARPDTTTGACDTAAPGAATRDANCKVVVTSTGTIGGATRTITAVVSKTTMPPVAGALAFPGARADVRFGGSGVVIDGRDSRLADDPGAPTGTGPAVYGIAVSGSLPGLAGQVENALAAGGPSEVRGRHEADAGTTAQGAATIAADPLLTPQTVRDFVSAVRPAADLTVDAGPGNTASIRDVGSTCSASVASATCWGTPLRPKVIHVRGAAPEGDGRLASLSVVGDGAGTGILVIENANVEIAGNFRWNGLIVLTGRNVGIRYRGNGVQRVYGATIVNESNEGAGTNVDLLGPVSMLYSREALELIQGGLGRRLVTVSGWTDR